MVTDTHTRPTLLFFGSSREGRSRRAERFLAQVLQRRRNHETFVIRRIPRERHPDLHERFRVEKTPTILVAQGRHVVARLSVPRGAEEIQRLLAPWLH